MTATSSSPTIATDDAQASDSVLCQSCAACCAFDETWPRFSLESDAEIAAIPEALISASGSGMRCDANRCAALNGDIGSHATCTVYAVRPLVCRDCQPGDEECSIARAKYGFSAIEPRTRLAL
jgi:uncharacterized protein